MNSAHNVVIRQGFDDTGYTSENSLARAYLSKPDVISPVITHLQGKESAKFPLTFLTEGQKGGVGFTDNKNGINDVDYTWKVIGRMKRGDVVCKSDYTPGKKPGHRNSQFFLYFPTKWLLRSHSIN